MIAVALAILMAAAPRTAVPRTLVPANSEESAWSPNGDRLAFDSNRDSKHFNVYVMELATGRVTRVTNTQANDVTPSWSPDGRRLAFTSDRTGHNEIFVVDADGSALRQVTHDGTDSFHPFWSSDGRRLIYCSADPPRAGSTEVDEIYTVRPDGSDRTRVVRLGGINTFASISPNGKRILFRKLLSDGNSEVWVMGHDGREPRNLTNDPAFDGWPGWSPEGRRIVFASNRRTKGKDYDIYVMSADGSGVRRLTDVPGRNTSPKWSPDGSKISFDNSSNGRVRILQIRVP